MSHKISFNELEVKLQDQNQKSISLTPAGDLKCEWFKRFLAQEVLKNQERIKKLKK